ncbi:hypothetical protein SDC9_83971 [bioreactor metagenome]|uniref:Uncharacterized protein n=1 Tax=bioreactor metagenome TaxID=1076179 RepID=A0A644ZBU5_9ZZZZ
MGEDFHELRFVILLQNGIPVLIKFMLCASQDSQPLFELCLDDGQLSDFPLDWVVGEIAQSQVDDAGDAGHDAEQDSHRDGLFAVLIGG